jgi:hypothetical protein
MHKIKRNVLIIGITITLLTPLSLIGAQITIIPTDPVANDVYNSWINASDSQNTYISEKLTNAIDVAPTDFRNDFTYLINETTTTVYGYLNGTSDNLFYNSSISALQLNQSQTQGSYVSQLFDVGKVSQWLSTSWRSNAMGELAGNQLVEDRFVTGNVNMSDNVLLMHMNEQSGPVVDDSSGKGNHGNGSGVTYGVAGQFGTAIGFDGVDDRVTLGVNALAPDLNGSQGITISTWINPASLMSGGTADRNTIADILVDAASSALYLTLRYGGRIWFGGRSHGLDGYQSIETDTALVQLNTWQHIAGVLDFPNDKITLYYNGQNVKEGTVTFGSDIFIPGTPTSTDVIGCNPALLTHWFNGSMDELSVWGRRLSEQEIIDVYQRGVMKLNFSVRGGDEENWVDIDDDSPQNVSIPDSRFFQYKVNFSTADILFSPQLYNVTIYYEDDTVPPSVTVLYPNGGEVVSGTIGILWDAWDDTTVDLNGTILIEYSGDNGSSWFVIASGENNTGVFLWDTTVVPDGDGYLVRVSATDESNNTGSDVSDGVFSVDNIDDPPVVTVLYPNGGEVVSGTIGILWDAWDDTTVDLNGTILIEYSGDNGSSWFVIASGENNTGVFLWDTTVVPDGDGYLVRVSATDESNNTGSDVSDGVFSVDNVDDPPVVTVLYPNGGEVVSGTIGILWDAWDDTTVDLNGTILIEYSGDNGSSWFVIASGENNTGVFLWDTTVVPDGDGYLVRVSATDESNNTGSDVSDGVFSVDNIDDPPVVTVLYPNGGEVVSGTIGILWDAWDDTTVDLNGTILIEYSGDNGSSWFVIASGENNTGVFLWDTTVVPDGDGYLVRVSATDESNNTGSDVSDGVFSVDNIDDPPVVTVLYPNGGEVVSGTIGILWDAWDDTTVDLNGTILIEYSGDNGSSWFVIASGENNTGVFLWDTTVVPDGDGYLVRVSATDESNNTGSDVSDATFVINNYAPQPPQVSGQTYGGNGIIFNFTTVATDPQGDQIYYKWDWDDGNESDWLGPVNSSEPLTKSYAWSSDGNYSIRVKAKNTGGSESAWSDAHLICISEHINFSNVKLGYVYFKLFSFNRSFIFSDFLLRLGLVIIFTSHELELEAYASEFVTSVTFRSENQMKIKDLEITDDDSTDGFSCTMNVTRGVYVLNITAYDANGTLIDKYSLFTVFFIRIGRYATDPLLPDGGSRLQRYRILPRLRH